MRLCIDSVTDVRLDMRDRRNIARKGTETQMGISIKSKQDLEDGRIPPNQLFDEMAACEFLGGISPRTLLNLVNRGHLTKVKIVRRSLYRYKDLVALAKRGTE